MVHVVSLGADPIAGLCRPLPRHLGRRSVPLVAAIDCLEQALVTEPDLLQALRASG